MKHLKKSFKRSVHVWNGISAEYGQLIERQASCVVKIFGIFHRFRQRNSQRSPDRLPFHQVLDCRDVSRQAPNLPGLLMSFMMRTSRERQLQPKKGCMRHSVFLSWQAMM